MRIGIASILFVALLSLVSCKQQDEGILNKREMTDLLVDIHKSEAVIALNYSKFPNDSAKSVIREAVFNRHKITQAQFDSSLVWYGNHIEEYMEIYDKVIERLNQENEEIKALIAQDNAQILTRAGDTVDIWKRERQCKTHHIPRRKTRRAKYQLQLGENRERGMERTEGTMRLVYKDEYCIRIHCHARTCRRPRNVYGQYHSVAYS